VTLRGALIGLIFILLGIAALRDVVRIGNDLPWRVMYDFQDFYCAGAALDEARNPYTYEPLRTCEHRVDARPSVQANPSLAIPAPQPPYDFPIFMALAKLRFADARGIYAAAIVIAVLLSAIVLWRLEIPLDVALLSLALAPGYQELAAGQIVPFVLLTLVLAGWMLAQRRDILCGIFAGLTALEPHLGAGVALSVLFFVPRARWSLIATCVSLTVVGVVATGPRVFATYLVHVLPAQAWAEVAFPPQYSLTYVLHAIGISDSPALALGTLSFGLFLIAGLAMAPRLSDHLRRRELLVFFPAATAIMAGAYVHVIELAFAIPAALVFARFAHGLRRSVCVAAVSLLTVPWIAAWGVKKLFLASVFVCAALLYRLRAAAAIGIGTTLLVAAAVYLFELHPPRLPAPAPLPATAYAPWALVQVEWRVLVQQLDTHDLRWFAIKIPGWCALTAIFITGLLEYRAGQGRSGIATQRGGIDGDALPLSDRIVAQPNV
jgi:hypothetical protein